MDSLSGVFSGGRGRGRRKLQGSHEQETASILAAFGRGRGRGEVSGHGTGQPPGSSGKHDTRSSHDPVTLSRETSSASTVAAAAKPRSGRVLRGKGGAIDDADVVGANQVSHSAIKHRVNRTADAYDRRLRPPLHLGNDCIACGKPVSAADSTWQCSEGCFGLAHLSCMQGWARKHVGTRLSKAAGAGGGLVWDCPNSACGCMYPVETDLRTYRCFCGKEADPSPHGFSEPHSCGGVCGRQLPGCPHFCSGQCHRGPCGPCPQTVRQSCHCGRVQAVRRCGAPRISCGTACGKPLRQWWVDIQVRADCQGVGTGEKEHGSVCAPLPGGAVSQAVRQHPELQEQLESAMRSMRDDWDEDEDEEDDVSHGLGSAAASGAGAASSRSGGHSESKTSDPALGHMRSTDFVLVPMVDGEPVHPDVAADFATQQNSWSQDFHTLQEMLLESAKDGRWIVRSRECSHRCSQPCHAHCLPCREAVHATCRCGSVSRAVDCCDSVFTCATRCAHVAACGRHKCSRICCDGKHMPCPMRGKPVTCGCGANSFPDLPCDASQPSCGGTCGKRLECGRHSCELKCGHAGSCGPCPERRKRTCQCGATEAMRPCSEAEPFQCAKVCGRQLSCGRAGHVCRKRCCGGKQCRPCRRACGRMLSCGQHRCDAFCHDGPCLPCREVDVVTCACGSEVVELPCGDGADTKPPTCMRPCTKTPDCHHEKPQMHSCHFGPCPRCTQPCGLLHDKCKHPCTLPCHHPDACPPCKVEVERTCVGGHTRRNQPCCMPALFSCDEPCGNMLGCGKHKCTRKCHALSKLGEDKLPAPCGPCQLQCNTRRPCGHRCAQRPGGLCHAGSCPPCRIAIESRCACGSASVRLTCTELHQAAIRSILAVAAKHSSSGSSDSKGDASSIAQAALGIENDVLAPVGTLRIDPQVIILPSQQAIGGASGDPARGVEAAIQEYLGDVDSSVSTASSGAGSRRKQLQGRAWGEVARVLQWNGYEGGFADAVLHNQALQHLRAPAPAGAATAAQPTSMQWLSLPGATCDRVCSKRLPFCTHRCQARCHHGPCPAAGDAASGQQSCQVRVQLKCPCGRLSEESACERAITMRAAQGIIDPTRLSLLACDKECEKAKAAAQEQAQRDKEADDAAAQAGPAKTSKKQKQRLKEEAARRELEAEAQRQQAAMQGNEEGAGRNVEQAQGWASRDGVSIAVAALIAILIAAVSVWWATQLG